MADAVDFARRVFGKLDAEMVSVQGVLMAGNVSDWPAYQNQVGRLRGLMTAREIIRSTLGPDARYAESDDFS